MAKEGPNPGSPRGEDVSCYGMLLRTSNPPKVEIDFSLDDTRYSALLTITDDPPRVVPAR
ncbi:MAG: hypothetical protein WAU56_09100 [Steroidobacteraceae bacterium]